MERARERTQRGSRHMIIQRRKMLTLIAGAAAWPSVAQAQQGRMPVLGFLGSASEARYTATLTAVHKGLNEAGYVEKRNLLIEYRWADFQYDRLPGFAAELVKRQVDDILATGGVISALTSSRAAQRIPT